MLICSMCKEKIEKPNEVYQISLGGIIKNVFYGTNTFYYHIDCLNENSKNHQDYLLTTHETLL
jgi:hypothetical protein